MSKTKSYLRIDMLALGTLAVGILVAGCRTKLNPAVAGFSCDAKTGICYPNDAGLDAGAGDAREADVFGEGGANADAEAGGGQILISAPATSPTYTNASVAVQVSFAMASAAPDEVTLFRDDVQLATLTAPFSFSWDTTKESEGTYSLTAHATLGGLPVVSAPVTVVVDRTPPTVVADSRVPAPGATEVDLVDPIQVAFSEPIAAASASSAVALSQASGAIGTKATLSADAKSVSISIVDRSAVTLMPGAPSTLTATVSSAVTDLAGNAIANPPQWSWTAPLWLEFGMVQGEAPRLVLDATGTPFLSTAFEPGATGSHVYHLTVNRHVHGPSWDSSYGSPETPGSLVLSSGTSIAIGADGRPIVAWSEQAAGSASVIHVARSTSSGWDTSFPVLDAVAGSGTNGGSPWLAIGASGALSIAWAKLGTTDVSAVYVAKWSGTAWSPLPAIAEIGATSPVLRTSSDGQPIVAWIGGVDGSGVSMWNGQAWSTNTYPSSYSSNLALDKAGRPVVAFPDGDTIRVRYMDMIEEFSTPVPAGGQPDGARLAIDSMNRAVVVWYDASASTRDLRVARWTGIEWDLGFGALSALPAAGTNVGASAVVIDATDSAIVAWQEEDPYRNATYVRKSNR